MTIGKLSGQCDFGQKGQSYCNQRGQSCVAKRVKVAWLFQEESEKMELFALADKLGGNLELAIKRLAESKRNPQLSTT